MNLNKKAIIFGIKGYKLTKKEKLFLKKSKPWGLILFSRNIKNIQQLKKLTYDIKRIFKDKKYPILIDEEGGNVSRLSKIIDFSNFSHEYFGKLFKSNKKNFLINYTIYVNSVCKILNDVGININTVPVLDIIRKKTHNILKTRCFSSNLKSISKIGNLCIKLYEKNKVATVIKHIPGHGLAEKDSHKSTPIVNVSKNILINNDFKVFKNCKSYFAMTAHVIYKKYDSYNTATHSKKIINKIIRNHIKFKGILISDDISMKSLTHKLEINALKALKSGCNLVLHCNGNLKEMNRLYKVIPKIDIYTKKKTSQFYKFLG